MVTWTSPALFSSSSSSHPLCPSGGGGGGGGGTSLVDGLGGDAEFAQTQLAQSQLQVFGEFPALRQNVLQPLFGHLGEAEVADGRVVVVHHLAGAGGGEVSLGAGRHSVLAGVQQAPVVAVCNCRGRWRTWVVFIILYHSIDYVLFLCPSDDASLGSYPQNPEVFLL